MRLHGVLFALGVAACATEAAPPNEPTTTQQPTQQQPAITASIEPPPTATVTAEASAETPSKPRSGTGTAKSEMERYADEVCACNTTECLQGVTARWRNKFETKDGTRRVDHMPPKDKAAIERAMECSLKTAIDKDGG